MAITITRIGATLVNSYADGFQVTPLDESLASSPLQSSPIDATPFPLERRRSAF